MPIVTKTIDAIYLGDFGDMSLGFPTGNDIRADVAGFYGVEGSGAGDTGTLTELTFRGFESFNDPNLFDNDFYVDRFSLGHGIGEGGDPLQPVTYVHQNTLVSFTTTTGGFTANMNFFQLEDGSVYMMPNPQESPTSVFRFENASAGQEVTGWSVPLLDTSDNGFPPMEGDWAGTAFPEPDAGPNQIVDGENSGEVMSPEYTDANAPTNSGGDIIDGADGDNDVILGNGGDDTIFADAGTDEVYGGSGNDVIDGGAANDTLTGDFADGVTDTVVDNSTVEGDDFLEGGAGDDVIYGDSANSASAGGPGVPGTELGDGPGSTGGNFDRVVGESEFNTFDFTTDAFYLGNDIPLLDGPDFRAINGETFSQTGTGGDRTFTMDELALTGGSQSFVGVITIDRSDLYGANTSVSSSLTGPQDLVSVNNGTADFRMNDGQLFPGIRITYIRDEDGNTFLVPGDSPTPGAFNSFRNLLETNDSGIQSFTIATTSDTTNGILVIGGDWADGQILETTDGDGGDDTIIGGEGADQMFGEGGDDTFAVGSAAEGAGDVITGGNGPDQTTDNDVLDLRGAGAVTIDDAADATDAGATAGTVTFADGSTLAFSQIETILTDPDGPAPDGVVDGEEFGEFMDVGYDDSNAPSDGGGDLITESADVIAGNGGDDTINAGGGDDLVDGGGDDDLLNGEAGADTLLGGIGTDTLDGGLGADSLEGGAGDDDTTVALGDVANGGGGDDDFFLDPTSTEGPGTIVIDGGADATSGVPDDLANGNDGDTLDFTGLDNVTVVTPLVDDGTGSFSGVVSYTNPEGEVITVDFTEIENVLGLPDPADGIVDGADTPEVMAPGYTDPQGDIIDGADGIDDTILGNDGDDTIDAGLGDDSVEGGLDDDLIDGNDGNDTLLGNEGNDTMDGGAGDDTLLGGDEADTLAGGAGDDLLDGEDGDDDIAVGGADTALGGLGDDVFTVDPTDLAPDVDVTIDGGSDGTTGDPAGPENGDEGDILDLSDQLGDLEVVLAPNPETGTVDGLDADGTPDIAFDEIEIIETGLGDDVIDGSDATGPVVADGNEGEDTLLGGSGDDTLDGGDDDDLLDGGAGDDSLAGGDGNDTLDGGEGSDTLDGGLLDDDITVGAGDTGIGGGGDDEFTVDPTVSGTDGITVIGGETDEEAVIDPTNNPDGRIGDVLDLRGLGPVDVAYDPTDPTFDPVTGVGESGTATFVNDDGLPVTVTFSEIEDVLTDGPADVTPVANPDTATTDEDTPVTIDVLANDTDPDTPVEDLDVTEVTAPNGIVAINPDGTLEYTPDPDFSGEDTITYTVTDPDGNTATGTVTVTVDPVNDAPVAVDDTATTDEATPIVIDVLANDSDPDNTPEELSVIAADAPNGIVDINADGTLSYEPDAGFVGTDTITYTIADPDGATSTATVTVTVEDVAEAPVANPDTATVEEGEVATIDVLANDTDPDNAPEDLTVIAADAPNGIVDINPDGTLSYEPDFGFTGEDTITYTITDPDGNTATSTVTVTVTADPGGDAPDAIDDSYDFDLDGYTGGNIRLGTGDSGLLGNDTDPNGDPLRVTEVEGSPNLRTWYDGDNGGEIRITSSGAVRFRDVNGDFADVPDGEVVQTSVTYTVSDGNGGFDTATVTVNVTGAAVVTDTGPDAVDDIASALAGDVTVIDVLANDTDPDNTPEELSVIAADAPNGIVDINPDGTLSYEPDFGFTGEDTITYTITDPDGNTDTATVTVTVSEGDVTPVANPDTATTAEDTPVTIDVLANDTDPDTPVEDLDVTEATAPNGTLTINPDGMLEYTPNPDFSGEDTITYTVTDPDGNTATGTVAVTVDPVGDAPVAVDDTATTAEDTPVTIDVLANDTDPDTPVEDLDVTEATAPNGTVAINPDGTLEYTPDPDFSGEDTITYTVTDPEGNTATGTVAVTVDPVNDAPVAVDDTATTDEATPVTIDVLANDSDPDNTPEELSVIAADAPNGIVDINADGTLSYEPDAGFVGTDTITYTIGDPDGATSTATVAVTVADVVDGTPVANPDTATLPEDETVTIDVLANDTDADTPPEDLDVTEATAPNGTVTINPDGTLDYTPDPDFNGTDEITYTVSDPDGNTATGTVVVTVDPVNDAPVAVDDTATTDEGQSVVIDVLANDTDVDNTLAELDVIAASALNGTVSINSDGTVTYSPNADFFGEDTITYTIADPSGATSTASVAVTVEEDVTGGGDGVVDGADTGEVMSPGYDDGEGDQIDGTDGINDSIAGNGGNDTIDAGLGNDTIDGGTGDDQINGGGGDDVFIDNDGADGYNGGDGNDTYVAQDEGHIIVYSDLEGNGFITQDPGFETDDFSSIENIVAAEIDGQQDKISFDESPIFGSTLDEEVQGISDSAFGLYFSPEGSMVNFGPEAEYLLSDILNGAVNGTAEGEYFIQGGDEDGQIGDVAYENFEQIFFNVEEDRTEAEFAALRAAEEAEEDPDAMII